MKKMSLQHQNGNQTQTQTQTRTRIYRDQNPLFVFDCLYCEEHKLDEDEDGDEEEYEQHQEHQSFDFSLLFRELDDQLDSLFSKQHNHYQSFLHLSTILKTNQILCASRAEAIQWILKVNAHYGFSSLTPFLAINYLDRILSLPHFQTQKPWVIQLIAVTCISLSAKVEEIQVPLLLDLQVEDSKYIFEAKTIQRMELLILSTLQWKMHPVTPFSFIHLITSRKLRLKNHIQLGKFFRRCERILLCLVADSRSVSFLPSELAISTMVSVIEEMENCNSLDFQYRLLNDFDTNKERVRDCGNVIKEIISKSKSKTEGITGKRKLEKMRSSSSSSSSNISQVSESPNGVMEANFSFTSVTSNDDDSWSVAMALGRKPIIPPPSIFKRRYRSPSAIDDRRRHVQPTTTTTTTTTTLL